MKKLTRKEILVRKYLKEGIYIIIGCFLMAMGTSLFLLPNQLSSGGVAGIATITYYLLKIPMGTMILLINIPLFLFSFFKIGKSFFIKSLIGTISLSYFIDFFDKFEHLTNDRLLACIYGGILVGIGTAIVLKANASTGGTDLLSYIIRSFKPHYRAGNLIVIDDGKIQIRVDEIKDKDIVGTVLNDGGAGSRKSINVPGVSVKIPFLSPKDINDLANGAKAGFDYVSASFVRSKEDIAEMRKVLDDNGGKDVKILAKIENQEGIDNFEEILAACDGIMVARGDMAVEVPFEEVPVVQKRFIKRCNEEGKLVITATQMLESMTNNPLPTRAEVSDVANAIYDRTGCIMLSGETAMGDYPLECVNAMVKIAKSVEPTINYWKRFTKKDWKLESADIDSHAAYTSCVTARDIKADAIIDYTHTGNSARRLAGYGPACPIFAITDSEKVYNQLGPIWNVYPVLVKDGQDIDDTIEKGVEKLVEEGKLEKGDTAVLCGGPQIMSKEKSKYAVNKTVGGILKI